MGHHVEQVEHYHRKVERVLIVIVRSSPVGMVTLSHYDSIEEVPRQKPKSNCQIPGLVPIHFESRFAHHSHFLSFIFLNYD